MRGVAKQRKMAAQFGSSPEAMLEQLRRKYGTFPSSTEALMESLRSLEERTAIIADRWRQAWTQVYDLAESSNLEEQPR